MELSRWEGDTKDDPGGQDKDAAVVTTKGAGFREWPMEKPFSIVGVLSRLMGGRTASTISLLPEDFQNCLSSPTHYKDLIASTANLKEGDADDKKRGRSIKNIPPLLEHLNADIQYKIFSFLDHLDLLRLRGVCQFWNSMVDDDKSVLWHNAYQHRFGPYQLEEPLQDNGNSHWASLFGTKWLMEIPLRFKRNIKTAYKHHTCSYIGCSFVVKLEKQRAQHEQRHIRRIAKRQGILEGERERQRKRKQRQEEKEFIQYLKEQAKKEREGG